MKTYVEGSGAREHCLRLLLGKTSQIVSNPESADLLVVGPEVPLVNGFADEWRAKGKLVFGPGRDGAQLEGSKAFLKAFLERSGVPTARYGTFHDPDAAIAFLKMLAPPYVVKTSGLAAGKGVLVTEHISEAVEDVRRKLDGTRFGDAGKTIVIEEGLTGPEASVFAVTDGKELYVLPPAQDAKRVFDNDQGPNTGGMGAYSPVPGIDTAMMKTIEDSILRPTLAGLRSDGVEYRGVLYAGLMLTEDGPKIIEYNVRFGDPDSQVSLVRYGGDLAALLRSAAEGNLQISEAAALSHAAVNVVLVAEGYPESPSTGDVISGIEKAEALGVTVLRAGVKELSSGELVTAGGRVLNVLATAPTLQGARTKAYRGVDQITWRGMHVRRDIAEAAVLHERTT